MPPDGVHDNTFHKSPYFQGGASISEKRLLKWRAKEKQVEKSNKAFEEELEKFPWEEEDTVPFGQPFQIVMGLMGYDPAKIEEIVKREQKSDNKLNLNRVNLETDVFGCLRKEPDQERRQKQVLMLKSKSFSSFGERDFSVRDWENDLVKDYTDSLTLVQPPDPQKMYRRIQSAPEDVIQRACAENGTDQKGIRPKIRPQSAQIHSARIQGTQTLPLRKFSTPSRMSNTCISQISAKHGDECKSANSTINIPVGYVNDSSKGTNAEMITNDPANDETDETTMKQLSFTGKNETLDRQNEESNEDISDTKSYNMQNAAYKTQVSFQEPERDASRKSGSTYATRSRNKASGKEQIIDGPNESRNLRNCPPGRRQTLHIPQRKTSVTQIHNHTARRRISAPSFRGRTTRSPSSPSVESFEDHEKVLGTPSSTENQDKVPHWKRDLMKEAPPSLAGAKGPEKIPLFMSRRQRRRELQQLVEDNVGDVRQICDQEHSRRMQSRMNVMITMRQVQEVVDNLTQSPEGQDTEQADEATQRQSVAEPGRQKRKQSVMDSSIRRRKNSVVGPAYGRTNSVDYPVRRQSSVQDTGLRKESLSNGIKRTISADQDVQRKESIVQDMTGTSIDQRMQNKNGDIHSGINKKNAGGHGERTRKQSVVQRPVIVHQSTQAKNGDSEPNKSSEIAY